MVEGDALLSQGVALNAARDERRKAYVPTDNLL